MSRRTRVPISLNPIYFNQPPYLIKLLRFDKTKKLLHKYLDFTAILESFWKFFVMGRSCHAQRLSGFLPLLEVQRESEAVSDSEAQPG